VVDHLGKTCLTKTRQTQKRREKKNSEDTTVKNSTQNVSEIQQPGDKKSRSGRPSEHGTWGKSPIGSDNLPNGTKNPGKNTNLHKRKKRRGNIQDEREKLGKKQAGTEAER